MCELWERGGVTLKPETENSQETKVPGPTQEMNLPRVQHDSIFPAEALKTSVLQF